MAHTDDNKTTGIKTGDRVEITLDGIVYQGTVTLAQNEFFETEVKLDRGTTHLKPQFGVRKNNQPMWDLIQRIVKANPNLSRKRAVEMAQWTEDNEPIPTDERGVPAGTLYLVGCVVFVEWIGIMWKRGHTWTHSKQGTDLRNYLTDGLYNRE